MKTRIDSIINFFNNNKYLFFCIALSFIVILFTSKNSILYTFNDWVDANAFFTVGKSMFNGVVPYRDIFEQKGLIIYFIYGLGYLLFNKAFYGIFILEIINFSIFLYFAHKIFNLYLDKKYSFILLPILAYIVTTSNFFVHGGSCEEFILSLEAVSLYYYFKHFKIKKLTNIEVLLNGILAGIVFMMKYTCIGLWVGMGLFILIDYLKEKDYKNSFKLCLYFGIGMLIPVLLCFIYLVINHALKDFIKCYFTINLTAYNEGSKTTLVKNFWPIFNGAINSIIYNVKRVTPLLLLYPLFIIFFKKENSNKYFKRSLIGLVLIQILILFWGLKFYPYYLLPLFVYIIISLISIVLFIKEKCNIFNKKYSYLIFIIIPLLFISLNYVNAKNKDMIGKDKDYYFQFKYADYINKKENPTLLNMGFLDAGLYTTTGIIPNTRFFEVQNINYEKFPDNIDNMKENVINKDIDFILYYTENNLDYVKENDSYIFDNYELVFDDQFVFENKLFNAFLFELKK